MVFHLVDRAGWALAVDRGEHRPPSLESQGFVHLSLKEQVLGTANRFFAGRVDLLLLEIDEARLPGALKMEEGEPGQLFPHFYGAVPVSAVKSAEAILPDADGTFRRLP